MGTTTVEVNPFSPLPAGVQPPGCLPLAVFINQKPDVNDCRKMAYG